LVGHLPYKSIPVFDGGLFVWYRVAILNKSEMIMSRRRKKFHPKKIPYVRVTNHELGRRIVHMRYDCTLEVLEGMLIGLREEMDSDVRRGYIRLVFLQKRAIRSLLNLVVLFRKIFSLCRPHMEHEFPA
jgi:hypothetical protein